MKASTYFLVTDGRRWWVQRGGDRIMPKTDENGARAAARFMGVRLAGPSKRPRGLVYDRDKYAWRKRRVRRRR